MNKTRIEEKDMTRKFTQVSIKLVALVCLIALPAASFADGSVTSDSTAKIRVERELTKRGLAHSGLMVSVDDHIVTLSGSVLTLAEKERAGRATRNVEGVQRVVNHLSIIAGASDAELAKAVRKSVLTDPYYGVFDWIDGQVMNGKVVISGAVREPLTKSDIEKRLMMVAGITSIENRIEVLPLSTQDDRLRVASLRLIYGNSSLGRYALGANPSIHVIVNNGRVTLKGMVNNKLERQLAENVLRTNLLAFEVKNELEVEIAS
jgi:osmotically-inducible protein OsmY